MKDFFTQTKEIYEHLGDELSRKIYLDCITYNLTEDEKIINESIKNHVLSIAPFFLKNIMEKCKEKDKVIFGAGNVGKLLKNLTPEYDWVCYVDNNYKNIQRRDIPVISFHEMLGKFKNPFLVLAAYHHTEEMME